MAAQRLKKSFSGNYQQQPISTLDRGPIHPASLQGCPFFITSLPPRSPGTTGSGPLRVFARSRNFPPHPKAHPPTSIAPPHSHPVPTPSMPTLTARANFLHPTHHEDCSAKQAPEIPLHSHPGIAPSIRFSTLPTRLGSSTPPSRDLSKHPDIHRRNHSLTEPANKDSSQRPGNANDNAITRSNRATTGNGWRLSAAEKLTRPP